MEGTSQPCKMARQGVSTAREERRDMGEKERRMDSKNLVMGEVSIFEEYGLGILDEVWMYGISQFSN